MSRSDTGVSERSAGIQHARGGRRPDALVGAALACLAAAASPLSVTGQPEQWTLERTVTIGSAFDAGTALTPVGGVIVEGDRLFVAQPWDRRLRVYSLTGDFIGFIGRDGEGPGEFRSVDGIGLHGGLVWIHDSDLQRLQYFDTEGRFVSSVPMAGHPSLRAGMAEVQGILADGSRLLREAQWMREMVESPRKPIPLLRFDPEGMLRDTVTVIAGRTRIVRLSDGRQSGWISYRILPKAESFRSLLSVTPDGSGLVAVHRGAATASGTHTFRVIRFDGQADTAWAHEVPYDPVRVPEEWRSRRVEDRVRGSAGSRLSESSRRQAWERIFGRLEFFPPVSDAHAGADGTTWLLLRTGVESSEWEVLDESGRSIARVDPPHGGGSIVWAGPDWLWFLEDGSFDIPYLVRYAIRRQ